MPTSMIKQARLHLRPRTGLRDSYGKIQVCMQSPFNGLGRNANECRGWKRWQMSSTQRCVPEDLWNCALGQTFVLVGECAEKRGLGEYYPYTVSGQVMHNGPPNCFNHSILNAWYVQSFLSISFNLLPHRCPQGHEPNMATTSQNTAHTSTFIAPVATMR
jgi:hypothetical protein